ncbi:MAG: hypothetical protein HRU13_11150, partial [Phycisphaerales bacterium]|nr:hypothetical protein [Phycisphaerales bacterium]
MDAVFLMLSQVEPLVAPQERHESFWAVWLPVGYLLLEWAIRLTLAPIIIRKHSAGEAAAWLALTLFQPIPGLLLYGCFGRQLLGRRRVRANMRAAELVETPERLAALEKHAPEENEIDAVHLDLFRLAGTVEGTRTLSGNLCDIVDSDGFIDRLIDDIDRAERHVHLLTYIYRDDATGQRVAEALGRAVERGVACRVLADGSGSAGFFSTLAPKMRRSGVEVRDALPSRFFRRTLARIDVRNHRKLAVIDGALAYAGSQNICDTDYGQHRYGSWIDLTARLTGPMAMQMQMLFFEDWVAEAGQLPESPSDQDLFPHPADAGSMIAHAIPSGPGRRLEAFRDIILSMELKDLGDPIEMVEACITVMPNEESLKKFHEHWQEKKYKLADVPFFAPGERLWYYASKIPLPKLRCVLWKLKLAFAELVSDQYKHINLLRSTCDGIHGNQQMQQV